MTTKQIIHGRLEEAAYKITDNFCYSCYKVVEGDYCPTCHTDDFMRHLSYDRLNAVFSARLSRKTGTLDSRATPPCLKGTVGVEYGTEWVIDHLFETRLEPVDGDAMFEELLDECYPEVKIGCCTFSPSQVMKELDPTCFNIGVTENLDSLAEDGQLYEHNGDYYQMEDLDDMLDDIKAE